MCNNKDMPIADIKFKQNRILSSPSKRRTNWSPSAISLPRSSDLSEKLMREEDITSNEDHTKILIGMTSRHFKALKTKLLQVTINSKALAVIKPRNTKRLTNRAAKTKQRLN